jgi:hypothetical protein
MRYGFGRGVFIIRPFLRVGENMFPIREGVLVIDEIVDTDRICEHEESMEVYGTPPDRDKRL